MSPQNELSLDKLSVHPVTAVLFTYNQEKYVRYAFEDLMDQDIDMMTVIISDDCSTDRTFQIIQELVQATNSRFDIRARQNELRLGFNNHINRVVAEFSPEVLIPFAGDDRFYPSRARILSDTQKKHRHCSYIRAVLSSLKRTSHAPQFTKTPPSITQQILFLLRGLENYL